MVSSFRGDPEHRRELGEGISDKRATRGALGSVIGRRV